MALFQGEDMVDVTTPDGRTLSLPRSIVPASMLPQPQQIASMPVQGAPAPEFAQPMMPPPVDTPPEQQVVEMGEPEVTPVTTMEPLDVKARPAVMKKLKAEAASPKGQLAAVQTQQNAAVQQESDAVVGAADIEAAEQAVVADAVTERNKQLDGYFANRQTDMLAAAEAEDAKYNEIVGMRKKIAGTKINREADHPVMAAIFAALAGIGSAMNGGKVDTLDILYNAIDRKVAAQTADLDQLGKVYGMTKEELEVLKNKSKSKLEFHNAMIAGETEKAVRHIEEITARSASDKTKANAKIIIAQLNARAADKTMEATRWGLEYDQRDKHQKAQIGLGYSQLKETKRSNMAGEQFAREKLYADQQAALASDLARGDEAKMKMRMESMKEVETRGIVGVDNKFLLTPEGRQKMADAEKLEADAAAIEANPDQMARSIASDKVAMMKQKAAQLRGDAQSFDVVKMRDTADAKGISKKYAASQTMMDTIDEIKTLYDQAGRGIISKSKLQQELGTKYGLISVAAKDAWELGAWDKGSAALVANIIGKDPTNMDIGYVTSNIGLLIGQDPEGFKNRLDAVAVSLEQNVRQQILKGGGKWDGKDALFTRKNADDPNLPSSKANAKLSQARSGVELEKGAEDQNGFSKTMRAGFYPLSPDHKEEAENAQSVKYPGLSRDQDAPFSTLLTAYKKGDTRSGDKLVGDVIETAEKRPDQAIALLHNLKEHAPSLYSAAVSGLPPDSPAAKQTAYEANNKIGVAATLTPELVAIVLDSIDRTGAIKDEAGMKELAVRARKKDPVAVRALADILTRKTQNKSNTPFGRGR